MHVAYVPARVASVRNGCGYFRHYPRKRVVDELKQANRRKDEFLAMLGHELQNPLAPIRAAVEITERFGPVEPTLDKARAIIERQVEHLTQYCSVIRSG